MVKLYTITTDGKERLAIEADGKLVDFYDLASHYRQKDNSVPAPTDNMMVFLGDWSAWDKNLQKISKFANDNLDKLLSYDKAKIKIEAPVRPRKVLAMAGNVRELKDRRGPEATSDRVSPDWFLKVPTAIVGNDDNIELPPREFCHVCIPETELGVIIGKKARWVSKDEAFDVIAGYTVFNDMVASDVIRGRYPTHTPEQYYGPAEKWGTPESMKPFMAYHAGAGMNRVEMKQWDGFAPIGPCIATKDEIGNPRELTANTYINGKKVAEGKEADFVWDPQETVHKFSLVMTLEPGDVISIGEITERRRPAELALKGGDVMEMEIPKIGTLRNPVVTSRFHGVW